MAAINGNTWFPDVQSQPIRAMGFEREVEAELIERLWSMTEISKVSVNDFIASIPFLFRMYGIENIWTGKK